MIIKFLLLTLFAGGLAQGIRDAFETLQQLTDKAGRRVLAVSEGIRNPTEEYLELIAERRECVEWEHVLQKQNMNDSLSAAVLKAMMRDNQFSNFQCIGKVARDTFVKIDASSNYVQNITAQILEKGLEGVRTLRLITPGLFNYVQDLYKTKSKEMEKAKNEDERLKILEKVVQKVKLLETILDGIVTRAKEIKFKFFEDYISYAFDTETALRRVAREGAQKMMKCIS